MSFAVIQTGGKQYKVSASEILKIERLNNEEGKTVEFKNVLFLNDDKTTEIGNPNIQGAKVEATILKNIKNKTILVFKKRRRKNSRKKYGHRQPISLIRITKIFSKNGKLISQAGPQKQITKEIVKADQARKEQMFEAKKTKIEEHKKIKKTLKKIDAKEGSARMLKAENETRKFQEKAAKQYDEQEKKRLEFAQEKLKLKVKKSDVGKKKIASKKKPLTTKKK
jgi:large subunit ribosomal protein L21